MKERLKIVSGDRENPIPKQSTLGSRSEIQAKFERQWLTDPEKFNPDKSLLEQERILRTQNLLETLSNIKTCVDLGSGYGHLSRYLADKGVKVTAVDIAKNALKRLEDDPRIVLTQDYVPDTKLQDKSFDLVLSADLIANLNPHEYRLFVAELVRLSGKEGVIVCSTPIDIHSDEALERFVALMETEIIIDCWVFSYHRLFIRWIEVLDALGLKPIANKLRNNRFLMNFCEKITKAVWQKEGISHALFLGRKKPLMPLPPKSEQPIERKDKRFVWE